MMPRFRAAMFAGADRVGSCIGMWLAACHAMDQAISLDLDGELMLAEAV